MKSAIATLGAGEFGYRRTLLELLKVFLSRFDSFKSFLSGPLLLRGLLSPISFGGFFFGSLAEFFQIIFRCGLHLLERWGRSKRSAAGGGAHSHAVLSDGFQGDQFLMEQRGAGVSQEFFKQLCVFATEVAKRMVVDRDSATVPHVVEIASGLRSSIRRALLIPSSVA